MRFNCIFVHKAVLYWSCQCFDIKAGNDLFWSIIYINKILIKCCLKNKKYPMKHVNRSLQCDGLFNLTCCCGRVWVQSLRSRYFITWYIRMWWIFYINLTWEVLYSTPRKIIFITNIKLNVLTFGQLCYSIYYYEFQFCNPSVVNMNLSDVA